MMAHQATKKQGSSALLGASTRLVCLSSLSAKKREGIASVEFSRKSHP